MARGNAARPIRRRVAPDQPRSPRARPRHVANARDPRWKAPCVRWRLRALSDREGRARGPRRARRTKPAELPETRSRMVAPGSEGTRHEAEGENCPGRGSARSFGAETRETRRSSPAVGAAGQDRARSLGTTTRARGVDVWSTGSSWRSGRVNGSASSGRTARARRASCSRSKATSRRPRARSKSVRTRGSATSTRRGRDSKTVRPFARPPSAKRPRSRSGTSD